MCAFKSSRGGAYRVLDDTPLPTIAATQSATPEEATASTPAGNKTSKAKNALVAMLGTVAGHPEWGFQNALEQTGGNVGEAEALFQRGVGFTAGTLAGAVPITLAAPGGAALTLGRAALTTAGEGALSGALAGGVEGAVGGHGVKGTAELAGQNALFGGALGGTLGGLSSLLGHGFGELAQAANQAGKLADVNEAAATIGTMDAGKLITDMTTDRDHVLATVAAQAQLARQELRATVTKVAPQLKRSIERNKEARDLLKQQLAPYITFLREPTTKDLLDIANQYNVRLYRLASTVTRRSMKTANPHLVLNEQATAAREAFNAALPARKSGHYTMPEIISAKNAARRAARAVTEANLLARTNKLRAANDAAEMVSLLSPTPTTRKDLVDFAKSAATKWLLDISDTLRNTKAFGTIGPMFADQLDMAASLNERLAGSWISAYETVAKSVSGGKSKAMREEIGRALAGELHPDKLSPVARKVHDAIVKIYTHVGDQVESVGLPLVDQDLTRLALKSKLSFTRLKSIFEEAAKEAEANGITALADFEKLIENKHLDANGRAALMGLFDNDGEFANGALMVPFRRSSTHMPVRYKPEYMERLMAEGSKEQQDFIQKYISTIGGEKEDALRFLRDTFGPAIDGPFEARGGSIQWSRSTLLDESQRIYDIDQVIPHYLDVSARRIASARTFGARDELLHQMREELKFQVAGAIGKEKLRGPAASLGDDIEVLKMFDTIWRASQGRHSGVSFLEQVGKGLAATSFLSPKTVMLQATQLVNPIAEFGFLRTLKGTLGALFNRELRGLGEVTGAVLSDQRGMIAGETVAKNVERLNPFISGIRKTDAFTRNIASITAGLHAQDMSKLLMKGGKQGIAAAEYLRNIYKLNPEEIVAAGGKLTTEQLRTAALHGSNLTMHAGRVQNLPFSRLSPMGRSIGVLQNYGSMQAKFFNTRILAPLKKGNVAPLAKGLAAMGILGWPAAKIQEFLTNKPTEAVDYFTDMWAGGVMGSFGKALRLAQHPEYSVTEGMVGAPVVAAGRAVTAGLYAAHGDFDTAGQYMPEWTKQAKNVWDNLTGGL